MATDLFDFERCDCGVDRGIDSEMPRRPTIAGAGVVNGADGGE